MSIDESQRKHPFIRLLIGLIALLLLSLLSICLILADDWRKLRKDISISSNLAVQPHLILDIQKSEITAILGKMILQKYPVTFVTDSQSVTRLAEKFRQSQSATQVIQIVHLLSGTETITEIELDVIAEETNLTADLIQRYIPGEMILITNTGLHLYIQTENRSTKYFTREQIRDVCWKIWNILTGTNYIHLKLTPQDAMSLYGLALKNPQIFIQ